MTGWTRSTPLTQGLSGQPPDQAARFLIRGWPLPQKGGALSAPNFSCLAQ
jgi:hypothetical protein